MSERKKLSKILKEVERILEPIAKDLWEDMVEDLKEGKVNLTDFLKSDISWDKFVEYSIENGENKDFLLCSNYSFDESISWFKSKISFLKNNPIISKEQLNDLKMIIFKEDSEDDWIVLHLLFSIGNKVAINERFPQRIVKTKKIDHELNKLLKDKEMLVIR